jgi:transcriptional regulator with XRE-family HTH domain
MNCSKIFAKKLKIARAESGFSQREVAKETGISPASIAHYETGHVEPSIDTIELLANFYNVSIDWLFGRNTKNETITKINVNRGNVHSGKGDMYIELTPEQIKKIKES